MLHCSYKRNVKKNRRDQLISNPHIQEWQRDRKWWRERERERERDRERVKGKLSIPKKVIERERVKRKLSIPLIREGKSLIRHKNKWDS